MRESTKLLSLLLSSWLFVHINSWWFILLILGTTQKNKDKSSQAAVVCARANATISIPAGSTALLCNCPPFIVTPGLHVTGGRGARVHINTHWTCLCSLSRVSLSRIMKLPPEVWAPWFRWDHCHFCEHVASFWTIWWWQSTVVKELAQQKPGPSSL